MASRNYYERVWDFHGQDVFTGTAGDNADFLIKDTSAAGTPTYALVTPANTGASGELAVAFDATNEIQNVCVFQNDILQYLIDTIVEVEFRVMMNQATPNAATSFGFGLASARNDAFASLTNSCLFKIVGASQTVKIDTRDGTTNNTNVATSKVLTNAYKDFLISFANGKSDIRFFVRRRAGPGTQRVGLQHGGDGARAAAPHADSEDRRDGDRRLHGGPDPHPRPPSHVSRRSSGLTVIHPYFSQGTEHGTER